MRSIAVGCAVALVAGATGCSEQGPSAPDERNATLPSGMFVSNARFNSGTAVSAGLRSSLGVSAVNVAFVSAAPGTFPNATSASVYNRTRGGAPLLIKVTDGGFDPVGVNAEVGDELSLAVTIAGAEPTSLVLRVPPRRPPEVVRTTPPKGRTDVALNVQVIVVFSEPVSPSSVTTSSVALLQNQVPVKGAVRLSADGLAAEFVLDGPLKPQTSYSLVVGEGVRDLDGDALSGAWTTSFTTSAEVALSGTIAFVSTREGQPHIYLSNPDGSGIRRLTNSSQAEFTPAWSRDGALLAFNSDDGTYVIRKDGSGLLRLPRGGGWPSWSPDGKQLLVVTESGLRIVRADGSQENEVVIVPNRDPGGQFAAYQVTDPSGANWSPDGKRIVFAAWTGYDFQRAFIMNLDGSNGRTFVNPFRGAIWDECGPVWSPDGSRVALLGGVFGGLAFPAGAFAVGIVDPETGAVTPIADTGTTCWDGNSQQTTSFSGIAWSPDGRTLAITKRNPPWVQGQPYPRNQQASIAIVNIQTKAVSAVIPDAYDPAWSRMP